MKKYVSEEFADLRRLMCAKYLANFSVFRSMPDNWALEQLFPIVPIHKLNKRPRSMLRYAISPVIRMGS